MGEEQGEQEAGVAPEGTGAESLRAQRIARAEQLRAARLDPYPPRVERTHTNVEVSALLEGVASGQEPDLHPVAVVGRVVVRPSELQVGIVSAAVGAPFLVHLVRRTRLAEL